MAQTYEKGTLYQISIIDFKPDPDQPRKVIDLDAPQQGAGIDAKNSRNEYCPLEPLTVHCSPFTAFMTSSHLLTSQIFLLHKRIN